MCGLLIEPIADLELAHGGLELLDEFGVHIFLHKYSIRAYAGLPRGFELAANGGFHSKVEVRVVEDDERSVSSKLQA